MQCVSRPTHPRLNGNNNRIPPEVVERLKLIERAIKMGDEKTVQSMLEMYSELDVNLHLPGLPMPLLHLAIGFSENEPDLVLVLLDNGGDPNNVATEDRLSPMHLAVMFDYEHILHVLMQRGGDPKRLNGDKKSCYDLAKDNVESEMKENCFTYFYRRSVDFRKSIRPTDRIVQVWKDTHSQSIASSIGGVSSISESDEDGFVTCDSGIEPSPHEASSGSSSVGLEEADDKTLSMNVTSEETKRWYNLMTEDESDDSLNNGRKLSTIAEESALSVSLQRKFGYEETPPPGQASAPKPTITSSGYGEVRPQPLLTTPRLNIASTTTTPNILHSSSTSSEPSYTNSTPSPLANPTKTDIVELKGTLQAASASTTTPSLKIPVTQSTYSVLSRFAKTDHTKLMQVLTPSSEDSRFSLELKLALENLHLIEEWGQLKIDLLQTDVTPIKKSKSFYNYLLLDPRVTKKVNFSGTHLKSAIIQNPEKFETFLKSVFYIGKGCGTRPIQHLVDAKLKHATTSRKQFGRAKDDGVPDVKINKILEIWKSGLGVIVVSVHHYSSEKEANVNEAAMIDAIDLAELSNIKKGSYNGTLASTWPQKSKNQFGSFLLYKAFCTFVVSDHKSFRPQDV